MNQNYVHAVAQKKDDPLERAFNMAYVLEAGLWPEYEGRLKRLGLSGAQIAEMSRTILREIAWFRLAIRSASRFFVLPTHGRPVTELDFLGPIPRP